MTKHDKGDAFIHEKTGSATMINLDGKWEHNFVDDIPPVDKESAVKPIKPVKR